MDKEYPYDVALSFAGEERVYVEQVAEFLRSKGIRVFYDEFEEVNMWGKELIEHFDDIYRNQARYCIMFLSRHYAQKAWPRHEKQSALARALGDQGYILPARFDDTDIPGLQPTKGYIDLRKKTPQQLGDLIIRKLGRDKALSVENQPQPYRRPKVSQSFNPYEERQEWFDFLIHQLKIRCQENDVVFSHFDKGIKKCLRFMINGKVLYSIDIEFGGMASDQGVSFGYAHGEMPSYSSGYNAWGDFEWDKEKGCVVFKLNDFSASLGANASDPGLTQQGFLEYVWEKVCEAVETEH